MSDARDQINLAAWMERRMDAIGPYGPHILDGVRRYEARIAHHDDVVRELQLVAWEVNRLLNITHGRDLSWRQMLDGANGRLGNALAKIAQEG